MLIVFVSYHSFAQDDVYYTPNNKQKKEKEEKDFNPKKRKINSGYVFIDGKYVEPPYRVKRRGLSIYVNDYKIGEYDVPKTEKRIVYKTHPGLPPNINKMDSIDAMMNARIEGTDIKYSTAIKSYLYTNYSYESSVDSLREYIASFPNIKSVSGEGLIDVEAYNGHKRKILISSSSFRKSYKAYNSKEKKLNHKRSLRKYLHQVIGDYKSQLNQGDVFFIFQDTNLQSKYRILRYRDEKGLQIINKLNNVCLNDSLSKEQKINLINREMDGNVFQRYTPIIVKNFDYVIDTILFNENKNSSNSFIIDDNYDEIFKADVLEKTSNISKCPSNTNINFGFPDPWSNRFFEQFTTSNRINQIVGFVEDQGYNLVSNIYSDQTNGDDDWGTLTYDNFCMFTNGGINYWESHGDVDCGYIHILYLNTEAKCLEWFPNHVMEEGFYMVQPYDDDNGWNGNDDPFILVAEPIVFTNHWKQNIDNSQGITIINSCNSYSIGVVEACGNSGATFGFEDETLYTPTTFNMNRLFKRLNGKNGASNELRNTAGAYNDMTPLNGFKLYPPDANITLCPATKEYYPEKNAIVSSEVSTGFFETDTWCDATQPAWKALKLEFSNGDLSYNPVNDVYWENPVDGRSNKIIYEWSGTEGNVKVKVFPQYIIAYGGGGQQLDFDKVCPNGEEGTYSFSVVDTETEGFTCNFSASSTSVCSGNTVRFIPYCTNEITSYSWHFEGGNPELTTESNPEINYGESGLYDVTFHAWNSENEVFSITKNDYIYVYDNDIAYDNPTVSCDYFLYGDAAIKYMVYVDYVPEGYSYNITVYYGDGTTSSTNTVENPTILESIRHYSDYGTYYPLVEVKLTGQDEPLFITDCGNVDVVNLNPCSNFTADFNFYPEDPQPNEEIFFEPIINNCGENCYWSWDFASEPSSPVYNDDPVWCSLNTNVDVTHTYNSEGNYYVKLTVYESENGCPPFVVEKEVPVGYHVTCFDPINIYCSHYKPGNPIDRVLVRKYFCALELYWHHTINTYDQCQPINHPDFAEMSLYKLGTPSLEINTNLIRTSPYSSSDPPWIWPHDYCYYSLLTYDYLPYGRYIFKVDVSGHAGSDYQTAVGKIDVDIVDCDLIATFNGNSSENDAKFADAVNNPPYYSSGKFILNSSVNEFVNSNSGIYNACNGIILCDGFKTGNKSFIATGYGFADCIIDPIYWWGYYYSTFPDIIDESQNSIILTFEASPNPYRDFVNVHIELSKSSEAILTLFNYNGAFIEMLAKTDLTVGLNEFEFDLGSLSPGTYMLKALINDSEEKTLKIIKH